MMHVLDSKTWFISRVDTYENKEVLIILGNKSLVHVFGFTPDLFYFLIVKDWKNYLTPPLEFLVKQLIGLIDFKILLFY